MRHTHYLPFWDAQHDQRVSSAGEQSQLHLLLQRNYEVSFHTPGPFHAACSFRTTDGVSFPPSQILWLRDSPEN